MHALGAFRGGGGVEIILVFDFVRKYITSFRWLPNVVLSHLCCLLGCNTQNRDDMHENDYLYSDMHGLHCFT